MNDLFEDNALDVLSKLFTNLYTEEELRNFIYVNGNGNLIKYAVALLSVEQKVSVFLDMCAGNEEAVRIYMNLRRLSFKHNGMLRVYPIVCSEYYYIQSIFNNKLILDHDLLEFVTNMGFYKSHALYASNASYVTTFEKFCKLVLKKAFVSCIGNKTGVVYCNRDCVCCDRSDMILTDKAVDLLRSWTIRPECAYFSERLFSDKESYEIHVKLVESFNSWQVSFSGLYMDQHSYRLIKPFIDWSKEVQE